MSELTTEEVQEAMIRLAKPIMEAVESCKSTEEIMMLASVMMTTAQEIFVNALGKEGADDLISGLVKK